MMAFRGRVFGYYSTLYGHDTSVVHSAAIHCALYDHEPHARTLPRMSLADCHIIHSSLLTCLENGTSRTMIHSRTIDLSVQVTSRGLLL